MICTVIPLLYDWQLTAGRGTRDMWQSRGGLRKDENVPYDAGMDIQTLRNRLLARRGQWAEIAQAADVNRRTIYRLLNEANANPTISTVARLDKAMRTIKPAKADA